MLKHYLILLSFLQLLTPGPLAAKQLVEQLVDLVDYQAVLAQQVDAAGMVNYAALKAERAPLDRFIVKLGAIDNLKIKAAPVSGQVAFWINAYNAITLQTIIDHYPIKKSFPASLTYPRGIRHISGAWSNKVHLVGGTKLALDDIEHQVLRKELREPRIHIALVCAAMGCPALRSEPYTAERLQAQFDDQARRFLAAPQKFRIDKATRRLFLSPIFDWFGEDFVAQFAEPAIPEVRRGSQTAVLNYISQHLDSDAAAFIKQGGYRIAYLSYDWALNERRP